MRAHFCKSWWLPGEMEITVVEYPEINLWIKPWTLARPSDTIIGVRSYNHKFSNLLIWLSRIKMNIKKRRLKGIRELWNSKYTDQFNKIQLWTIYPKGLDKTKSTWVAITSTIVMTDLTNLNTAWTILRWANKTSWLWTKSSSHTFLSIFLFSIQANSLD